MACPEVQKLREDAGKLYRQLREKLRLARERGVRKDRGPAIHATDYEPFLRNKLNVLSGEIQRHLENHGCE